MSSIPILDLASPDKTHSELCDVLVEHLSTIGFVYLANHGVDDKLIYGCRAAVADFFAKDLAFKESFVMEVPDKHIGYKSYESEKLDPRRKERDAREAFMFDAHDPNFNVWPTELLRDSSLLLVDSMGRLARRILRMIGAGLKLPNPNHFEELHSFRGIADASVASADDKRSFTTFRFNHYPLVPTGGLKDDQVQCGEHADYGTITLLVQDHVPGLEVQTRRDGAFILAPPIPSTIILNIGLLMENWTAGRLRATLHRVIRPLNAERTSLVLFVHPDNDVTVEPLEELKTGVGEQDLSKYQAISGHEVARSLIDQLNCKGEELVKG